MVAHFLKIRRVWSNRRDTSIHCAYGKGSEASIDNARAVIILGRIAGGLPFVCPSVQGRIRYLYRCAS